MILVISIIYINLIYFLSQLDVQYIVENIAEEEIGESSLGGNFFPEAELEEGDATSDVESEVNQQLLEEPI